MYFRLQRFEKTNEMLTNCNALSASRLKTVGPEFKKHTQLLLEMKKDLDYIFKKIRVIKTKLSSQYPEAFQEALRSSLAEECHEEEEDKCLSKKRSDMEKTNVSGDKENDSEDKNSFVYNRDDSFKKKDTSESKMNVTEIKNVSEEKKNFTKNTSEEDKEHNSNCNEKNTEEQNVSNDETSAFFNKKFSTKNEDDTVG